ncbi:ABC transporter permease [Roseinatronobacter alkalisoli]|uniref:ABC transporter permease n=1 Tax=Roseinatronobacter alkalisoli TaxID=3028235 RepID=A0ABT5TG80_9RHOB|nr:ABC transporter permease [Roseinatronobacter sp. HJB301]MDD7972933.1 ABC transporter permease [Roseinatronobacter sp. HJB301]
MSVTKEHSERLRREDVRQRWLLSVPALITIILFAAGPLLVVLLFSFMERGDYGGVKFGQFSLEGWISVVFTKDIFDDSLILAEANLSIFWRSVKLALLTMIGALLVGFPTAYFIANRPASDRNLWLFLITIPFWTNLLVRTFAIMDLIRNTGHINRTLMSLGVIDEPIQMLFTDGAVLFGLVYVYLPLMVLPIYASLEKLDHRLVEAGYDLYANRFQVLRHVVLPGCKPGIIAGCILVFIPAIGAYVTPRVLGGGKNMMMGNFIEQQFGPARNWPLGSALSITLLIIVMVLLIAYVRQDAKKGDTDAQ